MLFAIRECESHEVKASDLKVDDIVFTGRSGDIGSKYWRKVVMISKNDDDLYEVKFSNNKKKLECTSEHGVTILTRDGRYAYDRYQFEKDLKIRFWLKCIAVVLLCVLSLILLYMVHHNVSPIH